MTPNLPRTTGVIVTAAILAGRLLVERPVSWLFFLGAVCVGIVIWGMTQWVMVLLPILNPLLTSVVEEAESKATEETVVTNDFVPGERSNSFIRRDVPAELRVTDEFLARWAERGGREMSRKMLVELGLPERSYGPFCRLLSEWGLVAPTESGGWQLSGPGMAWLRSKVRETDRPEIAQVGVLAF